ncbi:A/G-specific adenine glycosylase [Candidatus Symbiothrix dinenymphae]|nr:A/G-specific adenine glycosylase [Candidatus Symbiothrix dinenymphae]
MKNFPLFSQKLADWFQSAQRDLPWRLTRDPYKIWVSEIILQQTQVKQGLDYYNRFIARFPDVKSLAEADEQDVLLLWQGLGYYSRARNLHAAAKTILQEYGGVFPKDYQSVRRLKGIGEYTAAAITSFAWNLPYPAVDGNVFRFLSRLFAIDEPIDTGKGKKYITELAGELMDKSHAGQFNQAMIEFGALQCTPTAPNCSVCPFADQCLARAKNAVAQYPVKQNRTQTKDLYLYYFHIQENDDYTYLKKRTGKGIWQNLLEFPLIESNSPFKFNELQQTEQFQKWFPQNALFKAVIENKKHILSHRIIYATFYTVTNCNDNVCFPTDFIKIPTNTIDQYPVHRLMQYYLQQ